VRAYKENLVRRLADEVGKDEEKLLRLVLCVVDLLVSYNLENFDAETRGLLEDPDVENFEDNIRLLFEEMRRDDPTVKDVIMDHVHAVSLLESMDFGTVEGKAKEAAIAARTAVRQKLLGPVVKAPHVSKITDEADDDS
jgi:hypothetical protein